MTQPERLTLKRIAEEIHCIRSLAEQNSMNMDYVLKTSLPKIEEGLTRLSSRLDGHIDISDNKNNA